MSPSRRNAFAAFCVLLVSAASASSCNGTTGGELLRFHAYGAGPEDAVAGSSYGFSTGRGYEVVLDRAKLHLGAVYLNRSRPTSVASDTSCTLAGIYVAEVPGPLDLDVLDPGPQEFSVEGYTTTDFAPTGEVWLTGGDIDAESDPTVILDVSGTASKDGVDYAFEGQLTIGQNREDAVENPGLPGAHPICKERVVSPVATEIAPTKGGSLLVRVDPRGWFANVDFKKLEVVDGVSRFHDASDDQPSSNLYSGLHSSDGVYGFEWKVPE